MHNLSKPVCNVLSNYAQFLKNKTPFSQFFLLIGTVGTMVTKRHLLRPRCKRRMSRSDLTGNAGKTTSEAEVREIIKEALHTFLPSAKVCQELYPQWGVCQTPPPPG